MKFNELDKTNLKIKHQLMGLSKISTDTRADLEKLNDKKLNLSSK